MTDHHLVLLACLVVVSPAATGVAIVALARPRAADALNRAGACVTAAAAAVLSVETLLQAGHRIDRGWLIVDARSAVFVAVIAVIGLLSALVSPAYLATKERSFFSTKRARRIYYLTLHLFWASLLAVPLAGNIGMAWLVIEATTVASALLIGFSGRRRALEAGWKYLVLTTAGLTVALLGIVMIYVASGHHRHGLSALDFRTLAATAGAGPRGAIAVAYLLLLAGLAAKVGWSPVHNWLPDAHSEAPPPVSAMLSAVLLPAVILVAWRTKLALSPALGTSHVDSVFIAFGLISLATAVPFLWRPMPWKRLLAYSSLEHMGIIALGIGFSQPLATAGVVLHVAGHALAKSLGFYASTPLFQIQPSAKSRPARQVAARSPAVAGGVVISLTSLSGLPPSPMFFSEVFILLGGFVAGHTVVVAIAAVMMALGFLGLAHATVETLFGPGGRPAATDVAAPARMWPLNIAVGSGLVALSVCAYTLPGSAVVHALMRGTF